MSHTSVIAFEGIDGSGKTVQMQYLRRTLQQLGMSVDTKAFPVYQSYFGREIGQYLSAARGVRADEVDAHSMALWFAMDRYMDFFDYVDGEADVLLINRYVLSNAVYQSIRERDLGQPDLLDWVCELEYGRLGLPEPDLYLVLDVEADDAGRNVDKKGFRDYVGDARDVYESTEGIQQRARRKYLEYADRCDNIAVISCMREGKLLPEEEIAQLVQDELFRRGIL